MSLASAVGSTATALGAPFLATAGRQLLSMGLLSHTGSSADSAARTAALDALFTGLTPDELVNVVDALLAGQSDGMLSGLGTSSHRRS
jgi:hypothetical protein